MESSLRKFNLGTGLLAVMIVFLMSLGAFVGAAQNSAIPDGEGIKAIVPGNDPATETPETGLDIVWRADDEVLNEIIVYDDDLELTPSLPPTDPATDDREYADEEGDDDIVVMADGTLVDSVNTPSEDVDNENDPIGDMQLAPETITVVEQNTLSSSLEYIANYNGPFTVPPVVDGVSDADADGSIGSTTRSRAGPPVMMPMGPHVRVYNGNTRGFHFVAPIDFTIRAVRETTDASSGAQTIEVVRFTAGPPPPFSGTTNNFVSLGYWSNVAGTAQIPCDIPIYSGDIIGIYGKRGTNSNSYGNTAVQTTIGGSPTTLLRSGMQYVLGSPSQMHDIWSEASSISRCEMWYTVGIGPDESERSLVLGPDNPVNSGQAMGNVIRDGTSYTVNTHYQVYMANPSSTVNYRGWTVFDLSDLKKYSGINVTGAKLVIRNTQRSYTYEVRFGKLSVVPFGGSSSGSTIYNQISTTSNYIGNIDWPVHTDNTRTDYEVELNDLGVSSINSTIYGSSSNYPIGMYIYRLASTTSARAYWSDIRLEVTFKYAAELPATTIAFGDELEGFTNSIGIGATNNDMGYSLTFTSGTTAYRGYAQWDVASIREAFDQGNLSRVNIQSVKVRFNHFRSGVSIPGLSFYHMKYNVTDSGTTGAMIHTDAGDGTKYVTGTASSTYMEHEWNLGATAVTNFQDAFDDINPSFFGVGLTGTSGSNPSVDYGYRLVITFILNPAMPRVILADNTPEGYEGIPLLFDASSSKNVTWGTSNLRFDWDWDNDATIDKSSTSPYANHTWPDDHTGNMALTVNDTNYNRETKKVFPLVINNVDPGINQSASSITPQPAYEANTLTFSGFTVDDPAGLNDNYMYFWDFDRDGVYDKSGHCTGLTIPTETWYYDDDFLGAVELLVVDEDGGTSNVTIPGQEVCTPTGSNTGYFQQGTSGPYPNSLMRYYWMNTYDYWRAYAKISMSGVPDNAIISKIEYKGEVGYNYSGVNRVGVHILSTDPTSASPSAFWSETNDLNLNNRIFNLNARVGVHTKDLTNYFLNTVNGLDNLTKGLAKGWIGFGYDIEDPLTFVARQGYMQGYPSLPSLTVDYITYDPGCLIPVIVKNVPPTLNCSNITVSPTTLNESERITINNISFCDPGNDTYEGQLVVGGVYESDWVVLGEGPLPPGSSTLNIAPLAIASSNYQGNTAHPVMHMNDEDESNMCWINSPTVGTGRYIQLTWSKKYQIASFKLIIHGTWSNPGNRNLAGGDVEYYDGSKWVRDSTVSGMTTNWEYKFKNTIVTDRIRIINLVTTGSPQPSNPCIYEWYVYGPGTGNWTSGWGAYGPGCFNNVSLNMTVPDDHPLTGTSWDDVPITINIRDDDDHVYIPNPNRPGLVSYWPFDEDGGSTAEDPVSGNHGTVYGAAFAPGKFGNALSFDGSSDYVMVGDKENLETNEFTISFWANITTPSRTYNGGIAKGYVFGSGTMFSYKIDFHLGSVRASVTNTVDTYNTTGYPIEDSNWHMWTFTFGNANISLYKDGVLKNWTAFVGTIDYTKSYNDFLIGARNGGLYSLEGLLDDVAFFKRALTGTEILDIYNNGLDIEFTDGMDSCNTTVEVHNVAPVIDQDSVFTDPDIVQEMETFTLYAEFEDPAAGLPTEKLEFNVTWAPGVYSGWQEVTKYMPGYAGGDYEMSLQPDPAAGKDTWLYGYNGNYNMGTDNSLQIGGYTSGSYNYGMKGLLDWDLSSIPKGQKVINASMDLYFSTRYYYQAEKAHWYNVTEDWEEGTKNYQTASPGEVTWNTMPTFDTGQEVASIDWAAGAGWVNWPLNLSIVQAWIDNPMTNYGMISQFDDEDATDLNRGYFYSSDYTTSGSRPKINLEFDDPLPPYLPRGIIDTEMMIPDDYPDTGTPFDLFNYTLEVRDDDLGSDTFEGNITVHNVVPDIYEGTVTPEMLMDDPETGIPEGTRVTLEDFTYDDVAFDVWSEKDFGFNYSIDWGDGTVTPWKNNFKYPGTFGSGGDGGGGGGGTVHFIETTWAAGNAQDGNMFDVTATKSITIASFDCHLPSTSSVTFEVYYKLGTYVGFETNSAAWTLLGSAPVTGLGSGNPTPVPIGGLYIPSGATYGLYVTTTGASISYTNGANVYSNDDVTLTLGVGKDYPFGSTFNPRTWNGRLYYTKGGGGGSISSIAKEDSGPAATAYNNGRNLVIDSNDNMYCAYTDNGTPSEVSISKSTDLGETWTLLYTTSGFRQQLEPCIAIDSNDVVHVAWRSDSSGYSNIVYMNSNDGGATWGNFKQVTTGTSSPTENYAPALAVDSNDKVHLVWFGRSNSNDAFYNIHYITRTSGGVWSSITMITADTSNRFHQYPSIAVDKQDNVHLVWTGQTPTVPITNLQYKKFDSISSTWGSTVMVTSSSTVNNYFPSMVADRKNNVHVAWHSDTLPHSQIRYIAWHSNTSSWSSEEVVSTNTSASNYNPSITIDYRGYVYIAWYKTGPYQIVMSMYDCDDDTWTGDIHMTGDDFDLYAKVWHPNVMLYNVWRDIPARGACLVYTADNGTRDNVYYMSTVDFNLTDYGPFKGIPKLGHLYRDDNPTATEHDKYTIRLMVRDDDTGIGAWEQEFTIHNVWPTIDTPLVSPLTGGENGYYPLEINFTDPGSGTTEIWDYWLDVDNSENWTAGDINGTVPPSAVTVIDDVSHGTIRISLPYNDDYVTPIMGLYVYDDDIAASMRYWNVTIDLTGDGEIHHIRNPSTTSATAYNNARKLVFDSKGNLYMVYRDRVSPYHIYVKTSDDMGETWTPPVNQNGYRVSTSAHTYQLYPSIAIDSNDVLHVTWSGRDTSSGYNGYRIQYANSADGGQTWGNYMVVAKSTTTCQHYYPSIAVDSKDTVHITWYGYDYATYRYYNIWYRNRTASGSWNTITMITTDTVQRYHYYPSIATDSKDNVHITWYGRTATTGNYYNIQYRTMNGATGVWGTKVMITSSSTYYQYSPCIVTDINDNVHIAWYGYPASYRIKYIMWNAITSTWGSITEITDGSSHQYRPSIGTDQRGYVYVTWYGYPSPYKLYLAVNKGSGFGSPEMITSDTSIYYSSQYYPSIVGYGPNCYPKSGAALVWTGYYRDPVTSATSTPTMYYSTDDFACGKSIELFGYKVKFSATIMNVDPYLSSSVTPLSGTAGVPLSYIASMTDPGSDDLRFNYTWGDGSALVTSAWFYNDGTGPDPYPSPSTGTAPFWVNQTLTHTYTTAGVYWLNIAIWDDDGGVGTASIKVTIGT